MKTIPPPCPEPETGPKYWRSLEQLADQPEFHQWLEQEFPAGASLAPDGESRREWMKLMSASFMLAGLGGMAAGCRRPTEHILPFAKQPDDYVHGKPQFYATSMPDRGSAIPLVVRSNDGRPTKVEGNPLHPEGIAGTDLWAQASILNLYDPDRAQRHTKNANDVRPEAVQDLLSELAKKFAGNQGEGLIFLTERSSSPSRARLQEATATKLPKSKWFVYEPVDFDAARRAASVVLGADVALHTRLDAAKAILSLDCDFIGTELDAYRQIRGFARGRKVSKPEDSMNRLYAVESLMTLTGANADHRLRTRPTDVVKVAAQIAAAVLALTGNAGELAGALKNLAAGSPANAKWAEECAKDLVVNKGKAAVLAGYAQPPAVHLIASVINVALGAYGPVISPLKNTDPVNQGSIAEAVAALNGGSVDTLVILAGNPAYNSPFDLNFADAASKANTIVRLGYYEDETAALKARKDAWHLCAAHYLESWGDARTSDGTVVAIQPLVEPLFRGLTELELLARLLGEAKPGPLEVVRETIKTLGAEGEAGWKRFLHDGFLASSTAKPLELGAIALTRAAQALAEVKLAAASGLDAVLYRDAKVDDGRYSNNGWLQELPDPVTKITWDNAVIISTKTARAIGLADRKDIKGDPLVDAEARAGMFKNVVLEVEVNGRKVKGPVWIQPGMADDTIGLALGYGRRHVGRVGRDVGFDAYGLRTSAQPHILTGAKLTKVFEKKALSTTQEHGLMEGRPVIREANLEQFRKKPEFAKGMDLEGHMAHVPRNPDGSPKGIYIHPYQAQPWTKSNTHQWGMVIDLGSCVGCAACVIACQSENNIPIVGKEQVAKGREMHWIRIDRYYSSDPALVGEKHAMAADDPQMTVQPMLCQHCESAPCESVCPVNATVHDEEGVNIMAYNRCVGTRYCSNNCPYKVRRFNFFDYNKREIDYGAVKGTTFFSSGNLYKGPLGINKNTAPEWEIVKLAKNPDVTVRMRGVMEKCTLCVQRIEQAKIAQKVRAGASGDVIVRDGAIQTACEQACPAEAIVFGNLADPQSRVSQQRASPLNYSVLGFLDTKPHVTYLARLRNPNPAMPDYREQPDSLQEYEKLRHDNPFESHGHGGGHGHEEKHAALTAGKGAA